MESASDDPLLRRAIEAFTRIHQDDPQAANGGSEDPYAVRYHQTLARWVERLATDAQPATLALRIAAHCQHLRRWAIPRTDFPSGKAGYKRWRARLTTLHCEEASAVLESLGATPELIARVCDLLGKKRFRSDPESALLEDAVCLTFLELEYLEFAQRLSEEKLETVVRKTWDKMSPAGQAAALELVGRQPSNEHWAFLARCVAPKES